MTSAVGLDLSGTPTFTLTMYNEMVKRGIDMTVFSPLGGPLEKQMKTIKTLNGVQAPDIILAQHNTCAETLKKTFPNIPLVFYSHGILPDRHVLEQPPQFPADWYIAINEEVEENLTKKGVPADKISIIRDFIDTEKFRPTRSINRGLKKVLFISNYKKWRNYKAVAGACERLGLELTCQGSPYGRNYQIEDAINQADLVVSWARGIMEAMACGRAALSWDRHEGDGYIDEGTYYGARQDNFSGRHFKYAYDADSLAKEMLKYDPDCGEGNRQLVMKYHNAPGGVDQILEVLNKFL
jgi:glycosyltransferase involved in cell wall biosynthesis